MSRHRKPRGVQNSPVVEATIASLTLEGQGVAHVDGKTVFIEGALPGEQVTFRYTAHKAKHDEGKLESVLQVSSERVTPQCQHFGVCGACSWQHIAVEAQIRHKQQAMLDQLQRIGKVQPQTVFAPLTAEAWGYRRKARLGVRWVRKKAKALVGFREKDSGFLAELRRCEILHPSVGERLTDLQALIGSLEARAAIPQLEVAVGDNATALVVRHMEPLSNRDTEKLLAFAREWGYQLYLQPKGPETVHCVYPEQPELYYAHPQFNTRVDFTPLDFFQVNQAINRQMVARALELLAPEVNDTVLDLFCGLGNFTLPLARQVKQVIGVEGDLAMVQRARAAAQANGIHNTDYYACNLMGEDLQREPWLQCHRYHKILLDPPRAGAKEIIPHIGKLRAERIVYVSCDPATLARDAGELVHTHGYTLVGAGVMDM
ncbi:MAG: 23S rRNA (uracil(1939)-C(5))-methyltransferase RlmD, partial [Thiothrix sp.]